MSARPTDSRPGAAGLRALAWGAALFLALAAVSAAAAPGPADVRADFVAGASEGDPASFNGWQYLASDASNPASATNGLPVLTWFLPPGGSYVHTPDTFNLPVVDVLNVNLLPTEVGIHPSARVPRYAVLRWTADDSGPVSIAGRVRKVDVGGGDGVTFELFVDGTSLFATTLAFDDSVGAAFSETATLAAGSTVDFVIGPVGVGGEENDSTGLEASIIPVLAPADARADFVAGASEGDPASFNGWQYLASDASNPTAATNGLPVLTWFLPPGGSYVHTPDAFNLPVVDVLNPNLLPTEVRIHPSARVPRYAVLRWTAPAAGPVTISGRVRKVDVGGGDGVTCELFVDGTSLFATTLAFNDSVGAAFSETATLAAGSTVDFVVGPSGGEVNDSTGLEASITPVAAAVPLLSPPLLGVLAGGLMLTALGRLARRRRG